MISLLVSSTGYVVAFVEFMRPDKFSRAAKYRQKEYDPEGKVSFYLFTEIDKEEQLRK